MKKRFTEEQIVKILQEAEAGGNNQEVCRRHGVSEPTFYEWRKRFKDMTIPEVQQFRQTAPRSMSSACLVIQIKGSVRSRFAKPAGPSFKNP